jgi:hypothetical protein
MAVAFARFHFGHIMKRLHRIGILGFLLAIVTSSAAIRAAEVLQNVPQDALGFICLKNLDATDVKVDQLMKTFGAPYPPPVVFLKAVTGIDKGLDPHGDFLLVALPSSDVNAEPQYGVWLPVADYDLMLSSLDATPSERISGVRIADEDLLVARHGKWALVMDPEQRDRMETLLEAVPNPPAIIGEWQTAFDANDVAIVLLRAGIVETLRWAAKPPLSAAGNADDESELEEFTPPTDNGGQNGPSTPNALYEPLRAAIHKWVVRLPKLRDIAADADAIGVVARVDGAGNALASLRLKASPPDADVKPDISLPPAIYDKGDFVVNGAGRLPKPWMSVLVAAYTTKMLDDLKTSEGVAVDKAAANEFQRAYDAAAADVVGWAVLTQPGDKKTGIYNNNFLVVRTGSAATFIEHVADVMRLWNKMHREAESDVRYVFDIEETKVGERMATQYKLDLAQVENMPAIPEIRQIMERFFGPGGKMRFWIVPVDEETVLLAAGTPEQIGTAVQALDRKQPIDWNKPELAGTNKLLPADADWRVFFNPRSYADWKKRQTDAMTDVPVLGARKPKEFTASAPIAISGKATDEELVLDAVVPADTIKSAGAYFNK